MKITALVENTTKYDNILTEHGLSLYLETKNHKILFDMGQSDIFIKNANTLNIDLGEVDICVLSHGHYDHGGGLKAFLELNKKAKVYISQYAFEPHYNGMDKYIGLDKEILTKYRERLIFTGEETKLDENLSLYSCNEKIRENSLGAFGLKLLENGKLVEDDFRHEQYLLISENGKNILISGCSHKGILDIERWFAPDVLVGGFHLMKLDENEDKKVLTDVADMLGNRETIYYTCHCTGIEQYDFLKNIMKEKLEYLYCGRIINI